MRSVAVALSYAISHINSNTLIRLNGTAHKGGVVQNDVRLSTVGRMVQYLFHAQRCKLLGIYRHVQYAFQVKFCWWLLNVVGVETHQAVAVLTLNNRFEFVGREQSHIKQF